MSVKDQFSLSLDLFMYKQRLQFTDLYSVLEHILNSGVKEVRTKIFLSENPLSEIIPKSTNNIKYVYTEIQRFENIVSGQLSGTFGISHLRQIGGKLYIIQHPKYTRVWILISNAKREFFKKPLRHFFRSIRPRCASPILTTPQIESLLKSFQKELINQELRVRQIGQRSRIHSSGAKKYIESDRKWTDLKIGEAFSEVREMGQWITDVAVEYSINHYHKASLKIGRYGEFVFTGGAKLASNIILNAAAKLSEERYLFLKDRNRSKQTGFKPKPFNIDFKVPVLSSKEQIEKINNTLSKIPNTTFTTLHGNPYFHAVMVDYKDGSVYEILIISPENITVIPQARTTVRSLQKLCYYVFSNFKEGELREINRDD